MAGVFTATTGEYAYRASSRTFAGDLTIHAYFKTPATLQASNDVICGMAYTGTGNRYIRLMIDSTNKLKAQAKDGAGVSVQATAASACVADTWYAVTLTWEGTPKTINLYVDALTVVSATNASITGTDSLDRFAVAHSLTNGSPGSLAYGSIAQMGFWSSILSGADISDLNDGTKKATDIPTNRIDAYDFISDSASDVGGTDLTENATLTFDAETPPGVAIEVNCTTGAMLLQGYDTTINLVAGLAINVTVGALAMLGFNTTVNLTPVSSSTDVTLTYGKTLLDAVTVGTVTDVYASPSNRGVHLHLSSAGRGATQIYIDLIRPEADLSMLTAKDYSRTLLAFDESLASNSIFVPMVKGTRYRLYRDGADSTPVTVWVEAF